MFIEEFLKGIESFSPTYREKKIYDFLSKRENVELLLLKDYSPISFFCDFEDSKVSIFENGELYRTFNIQLGTIPYLIKIINSLNTFVTLGLQTYTWKNRNNEESFPAHVIKCVELLADGKTVKQVEAKIAMEKKYFHEELDEKNIKSFIVSEDSFLGRRYPKMVGTTHYGYILSEIIYKWNDRPAFPDPPSYKKPDMD